MPPVSNRVAPGGAGMRKALMLVAVSAVYLTGSAATLRFPPGGGTPFAHAETFFACEQGYAFEVNGPAARCRRAASVVTVAALDCPRSGTAALTERVDYSGATDSCVGLSGTATLAIDRSCPVDYTRRVVVGPDRCERPTPESIRAPSIPVVR